MKITIKDFFNNPPPEKWWKKVKREIKIQLWCWSIEINHFLKKKIKMIKEQYIENKQKAMLADDLSDYIKDKHTQEKCIGFIDGYNAALAKVKSLGIAFVIERFSLMQKVMWEGLQYWVIEDKGESKVLVANSDNENATDYNDWWVEREKLNAL